MHPIIDLLQLINFDQCVEMLESIYRYTVTNQKGKDVPWSIIHLFLLILFQVSRIIYLESPIIDTGAVVIIQSNKMTLLKKFHW